MALAFGNKVISKVYFGEKAVAAIYLGTKKVFPDEEEELPGTGDIRLRIETTSANQSFPLFYHITTEEGGYVTVDWGDGNTETLTGKTTYQPTHTYATAGEYTVKLTGSKFTGVDGTIGSGYEDFLTAIREILSLKMPTDSTNVSLGNAFYDCTNLTGNIPEWDDCITSAYQTYVRCTGLTGEIPAWGPKITDANDTYNGCSSLSGNIPAWGPKITEAHTTYFGCSGLTGCSEVLLQDPMPSRITYHDDCVLGCVDEIRQHFTPDWGGTKAVAVEYIPGTGDIQLRIQTTTVNQSFSLFYQINTEEGGYISIDWGDGNKVTFTGSTTYQPKYTYATAGEYIVKLTGSKFTAVKGKSNVGSSYDNFKNAIREILSLKMPTDSTGVSLYYAFYDCDNLTGNIPAWDDCITNATYTYYGCGDLTGSIPEWGVKITSACGTYYLCTGLTGEIPAWGANITDAGFTYSHCFGLTGGVPEWGANITRAWNTYAHCSGLTGGVLPAWGANITNADGTYYNCSSLTGRIPAWGASIMTADETYRDCSSLTGRIPAWGAYIWSARQTYQNCSGLTRCSDELLQDPMPSRITIHTDCVDGCGIAIQKYFTEDWGGTKPG